MLELTFWGVFIGIVIGVALKVYLDVTNNEQHISRNEFIIGALVLTFIIAPGTAWAGVESAKKNLITYDEYWNGYEVQAVKEEIICDKTKGSNPCAHTYDCDSYTETEFYTEQQCDGKGNCTSVLKTRTVTKWHECPYCTKEYNFHSDTTLGRYTIQTHRLPDNPQANRWDPTESVPDSIIHSAGTGDHPFYLEVKHRIESGRNGPVTAVRQYDNFILASSSNLYSKYEGTIEQYLNAGLLPKLSTGTFNLYSAKKVYSVGFNPANSGEWIELHAYLNAALGSTLQGDLHFVIVQDSRVTDPDDYLHTLLAYWQSKAFGKQAFSKNGILVIVGTTDGITVDWARAATGMPTGNEGLLIDIQNSLRGIALDPRVIFGTPSWRGEYVQGEDGDNDMHINHTNGALESVLWGLNGHTNPFVRVCMKCEDEGKIGFSYLYNEIEPTGGQKIWILVGVGIVSCILWGIFIGLGSRTWRYSYPDPEF